MKKAIALLTIIVLTFSSYTTNVNADSPRTTSTTIEYISDNIYVETIISEEESATFFSATITKTVSKIFNIKNENNEILASFKLNGTFSYDGTSSTCTRCSYSPSINDNTWRFTSSNAYKSGNSAVGTFTASCYRYNIVVQTISKTITITCDANGNIS